jgi:formate hydrogenlyase subunit 3/multisubunit Na+/H+ antiporter MnhD subunit
MPVTFVCGLVFALSISGIPPFNGFASKWMIYQGIIDFGSGPSWPATLDTMAGSGSAGIGPYPGQLYKFISGVFLGNLPERMKDTREVSIIMLLPVAILALLCIVLGVFATGYFVPKLFFPVTGHLNSTACGSPLPYLPLSSFLDPTRCTDLPGNRCYRKNEKGGKLYRGREDVGRQGIPGYGIL